MTLRQRGETVSLKPGIEKQLLQTGRQAVVGTVRDWRGWGDVRECVEGVWVV